MNSFSPSMVGGGERCGFVSGSQILLKKNFLGSALPFALNKGTYSPWLKQLEWSRYRSGHRLAVYARIKKGQKHEYPWPDDIDPNMKSGHLSYLSHFKPLTEKPKPVTLAFEKPLVDLEKKIIDVSPFCRLLVARLDLLHLTGILMHNHYENFSTLW